jgi:hypothetical protein
MEMKKKAMVMVDKKPDALVNNKFTYKLNIVYNLLLIIRIIK